jgi:hypothetical protein
MTTTYKTDDSFFTTVLPPFIFYGWSIKSWLLDNPWGKYRYIRDYEIEQEFWSASQIQDLYPGVKLIGVVINPWARMYYAYTQLCLMKEEGNAPIDLSEFNLDSFENFIQDVYTKNYKSPYWFSLTTPMSKWFEYEVDGETKTIDYLIRDFAIEDDFKAVQNYFESDMPLDIEDGIHDYHSHYTDTTKEIVSVIFKEDIDKFGYTF